METKSNPKVILRFLKLYYLTDVKPSEEFSEIYNYLDNYFKQLNLYKFKTALKGVCFHGCTKDFIVTEYSYDWDYNRPNDRKSLFIYQYILRFPNKYYVEYANEIIEIYSIFISKYLNIDTKEVDIYLNSDTNTSIQNIVNDEGDFLITADINLLIN